MARPVSKYPKSWDNYLNIMHGETKVTNAMTSIIMDKFNPKFYRSFLSK